MSSLTTFTQANGYTPDIFEILVDLPPSQKINATRFQTLKLQASLSEAEQIELNNLTIALQSYIIDPDKWNKFAQALSSMEGLLLNFINLSDQGIWSNLTTYKQFQIVTLNGQSFMSKQNTNLNHSPIGGELDTWWTLIAKKGVSLRPLSAWNSVTAYVNNQDFIDIVYSNGSAFYCIQSHTNQQPSQAYPPVDTLYWGILSSKGNTGQTGADGSPGIGISFVGTYSTTTSYDKDQAVYYSGSLYASLQDGITGFLPTDNTKWSLVVAQGASVLFTTLRRTISVSTSVSNIQFLGGAITAFNPVNDSLLVYKNSTYIEQGQDYNINANGISIDKIGEGNWEGTVGVPITFNFVVIKNLIQSITWTDGSLIQAGSITADKLVQSVQDSIDSISTLSNEISVLNGAGEIVEKANKSALDTTNTNVTNLSNTVVSHQAEEVYQTEVHGLRVYDGNFQYYNGTEWIDVGGTDWSKYTPNPKEISKTIAVGGTYETAIEITGKGYVSRCIFVSGIGGSSAKLKITLDGTIVHSSMAQATLSGINQLADVSGGSTAITLRKPTAASATPLQFNGAKTHPFVEDTVAGMVFLPQPLFFNTSLLIEVTNTNNGDSVLISYAGGIEQ